MVLTLLNVFFMSFTKQATLTRRSTVLSLFPWLVFPDVTYHKTCYQIVVPDASCDPHGGHKSALLPATVDDGQEVDVVRNNVAAAPSGHVEVFV